MSVPARIEDRRPAVAAPQWNEDQVRVIKQLVCVGATDAELALFAEVCRKTGLDPFSRQIYGIKRKGQLTIQTSIDGFRLIAERTGKYGGQIGPQWCGPDAVWLDHWLAPEPPAGARVGVIRTDWTEPLWSFARFASYSANQNLWLTMPEVMIAKVAEANALRRAFPHELSSVYTEDEMDQADEPAPPAEPPPTEGPKPRGRNRYGPLHKAIEQAARNGGDGIAQKDLHGVAHDLACAAFGVGSLADVSDEQLRQLTERIGRCDAGKLDAALQWSRKRLGAGANQGTHPVPGGDDGPAAAEATDSAGSAEAEYVPAALVGGEDAAERARRWREA